MPSEYYFYEHHSNVFIAIFHHLVLISPISKIDPSIYTIVHSTNPHIGVSALKDTVSPAQPHPTRLQPRLLPRQWCLVIVRGTAVVLPRFALRLLNQCFLIRAVKTFQS